MKILFLAGFGPIVREVAASRKLYSETLGVGFEEETDGYLHTEALKGAKSFALWPLWQAAQSCFGKETWPDEIPPSQAWLEFDVSEVSKVLSKLRFFRPKESKYSSTASPQIRAPLLGS